MESRISELKEQISKEKSSPHTFMSYWSFLLHHSMLMFVTFSPEILHS